MTRNCVTTRRSGMTPARQPGQTTPYPDLRPARATGSVSSQRDRHLSQDNTTRAPTPRRYASRASNASGPTRPEPQWIGSNSPEGRRPALGQPSHLLTHRTPQEPDEGGAIRSHRHRYFGAASIWIRWSRSPGPATARTSRAVRGSPQAEQVMMAWATLPHFLCTIRRGGPSGAAYLSPHWRMAVRTGHRSRPLAVRR